MKTITGLYQLLSGSGMIVVWVMLFVGKQIPEVVTEPVRIAMHITAELATAIMLIFSGIHLLRRKHIHPLLFPLSMGCLLYTLIASPGYYAGKGEWGMVVFFGAMLACVILLLFLMYSDRHPHARGINKDVEN